MYPRLAKRAMRRPVQHFSNAASHPLASSAPKAAAHLPARASRRGILGIQASGHLGIWAFVCEALSPSSAATANKQGSCGYSEHRACYARSRRSSLAYTRSLGPPASSSGIERAQKPCSRILLVRLVSSSSRHAITIGARMHSCSAVTLCMHYAVRVVERARATRTTAKKRMTRRDSPSPCFWLATNDVGGTRHPVLCLLLC